MTSWYLRQNRPFLLQAIHTVTTFSTQERFVQSEELKRLLFTSALIKVESNIDLLLGLLTYLAWSTDAFLGRADLISRLMMLAISMIYDLRLFKPSSPDVQIMMTITQGRDEEGHIPGDETPYDLLERQRAVLACFILSSKCVCPSLPSAKLNYSGKSMEQSILTRGSVVFRHILGVKMLYDGLHRWKRHFNLSQ
jgi:hypothetical protein